MLGFLSFLHPECRLFYLGLQLGWILSLLNEKLVLCWSPRWKQSWVLSIWSSPTPKCRYGLLAFHVSGIITQWWTFCFYCVLPFFLSFFPSLFFIYLFRSFIPLRSIHCILLLLLLLLFCSLELFRKRSSQQIEHF